MKKKNTYHKSCYFLLNPLHASDPYPNSLKISEPEVFRGYRKPSGVKWVNCKSLLLQNHRFAKSD